MNQNKIQLFTASTVVNGDVVKEEENKETVNVCCPENYYG